VVVATPDLAPAVETYARLLGLSADAATVEGRQATLSCASGRIILEEGEHPGISGVVLGVTSMAEATEVTGEADGAEIRWLDPGVTHGLRIGLTPVPGQDASR